MTQNNEIEMIWRYSMIRMIRKIAPLCIALALVLAALPAFADGDYQAVVSAASMNV